MGLYPDSFGLHQARCLVVWLAAAAAGAQGGPSAGFLSSSFSQGFSRRGNDVEIELALFWPQQYVHGGWVKLGLSRPACAFVLLTQRASACLSVFQRQFITRHACILPNLLLAAPFFKSPLYSS